MLTGFNTDIPYQGATYHVQTEDKGLKNPIILSLIYQGGTILGAKRTNYADMITDGVVDAVRLTKAIEKQHQIIMAAIKAGKLEHLLERLNQKVAEKTQPTPDVLAAAPEQTPPAAAPDAVVARAGAAPESPAMPVGTGRLVSSAPRSVENTTRSAPQLYDFSLDSDPGFEDILSDFLKSEGAQEQLTVELASMPRLVAGEAVTITGAALYDGQWAAVNATVKLQIVGTTIKPRTMLTQCDYNGHFRAELTLPEFSAGTAALIIYANDPRGQQAELKLLIRRR
ncbi:MAG: hypothetical protein ACKV2V_01405 [Blastocatellia bacterium]